MNKEYNLSNVETLYNVEEFARIANVSERTIHRRYKEGFFNEIPLKLGFTERHIKLFLQKQAEEEEEERRRKKEEETLTFKGKEMSVKKFSKLSGYSAAIIKKQIKTGKTPEQIVENKVYYNGKYLTIIEFSKLIGKDRRVVGIRLRAGYTPEEIAEMEIKTRHRKTRAEKEAEAMEVLNNEHNNE